MTTTVYNLKEMELCKRLLAKDFKAGDVWLFTSGSHKSCTHCHGIITAGKKHIVQRIGDRYSFFNDHYHMSCAESWLVEPIAALMEIT